MALVVGTNCGFVGAAPSGDPNGSDPVVIDGNGAYASIYTTPSGDNEVTQMGWYTPDATEAADYDIGIYSVDTTPDPDKPNVRLAVAANQAKGTSAGWKTASVTFGATEGYAASTSFFLAIELDATATATNAESEYASGAGWHWRGEVTALLDSWGDSWTGGGAYHIGVYALYSAAGGDPIANMMYHYMHH